MLNIRDGAFSASRYWVQKRTQNFAKHLRWSFLQKYSKTISRALFTIFVKTSTLDVWQGFEYISELASKVKDVSFLN